MVRKALENSGIGKKTDFRWRGGEVTRIEGFSDAVFAFSVTLLVVSLEVPKTFDELRVAMGGFGAFALSFTFLVWIWYNHYVFFRRYGLNDVYTVVLNTLLLFVVLFYVYPLKFLTTLVVGSLTGADLLVQGAGGVRVPMMVPDQSASLMMVYGFGFLLVFLCFSLLYVHAYRKRAHLGLNRVEVFDTVSGIQEHLVYASVGVLAVVVAFFIGNTHPFISSLPYWLIAPLMTLQGSTRGKKRRKLTGSGSDAHPQHDKKDSRR